MKGNTKLHHAARNMFDRLMKSTNDEVVAEYIRIFGHEPSSGYPLSFIVAMVRRVYPGIRIHDLIAEHEDINQFLEPGDEEFQEVSEPDSNEHRLSNSVDIRILMMDRGKLYVRGVVAGPKSYIQMVLIRYGGAIGDFIEDTDEDIIQYSSVELKRSTTGYLVVRFNLRGDATAISRVLGDKGQNGFI